MPVEVRAVRVAVAMGGKPGARGYLDREWLGVQEEHTGPPVIRLAEVAAQVVLEAQVAEQLSPGQAGSD